MQRKIKNVVKNYTPCEIKVREATSNDPWGPSSVLMSEIATLTFDTLACAEIMPIIWKRLNDHGKNWRHVYKSLVLLEYLVRTGSERVVRQCRDNVILIQTLREFQYIENGLDCGLNIREAAKSLYELLRDEDKLKSERTRAGSKARFGDMRSYPSSAGELAVSSNSYNSERKYRPFMTDTLDLEGHATSTRRHSPNAASGRTKMPTKDQEMESTRPSKQSEEELQLQLALAMSKDEHEAELRRRKGEELKLQMAIEESKKTAKQEKLWRDTRESTTLSDVLSADAADPWAARASRAAVDPWKSTPEDFDAFPQSNEDFLPASLYSTVQKTNAGIIQPAPWEEVSAKFSQPSASGAKDDFLEISNRHVATNLRTSDQAISSEAWFGSSDAPSATKLNNMLEDLWGSPVVGDAASQDVAAGSQDIMDLLDMGSDAQQQKNKNTKRVTPEEFLGPNAKLIDFDELVSKPKQPEGWNPFAMTAQSKGPVINPFKAKAQQEEKSKRVPINQLQSSSRNLTNQSYNFESSYSQSQPSIIQTNQLSSFSTPALALMYTPQPIAQNQSYNPFL